MEGTIRSVRDLYGMTLEEFAEKLEDQVGWPVPMHVLQAWEQGRCTPPRSLAAVRRMVILMLDQVSGRMNVSLFDAIKRMHASGFDYRRIADATGLSLQRVAEIVSETQGNDE